MTDESEIIPAVKTSRHDASLLLAALYLVFFWFLGHASPIFVDMFTDFCGKGPIPWPQHALVHIYWQWTLPAGVAIATAIILNPLRRRQSARPWINIISLMLLMLLLALWIWMAFSFDSRKYCGIVGG